MAFKDQRVFQSDVRENQRDVRHAFGSVAAFIDNPIANVKFSPETTTSSPRTVTITVRDRLDVQWKARWVVLVCISSSEYSSSNTQSVSILTGNLIMQSVNRETMTLITEADGTCSFEIYSPSTTRYVTCTVLGRAQSTSVAVAAGSSPSPTPETIGYYGSFYDTTTQTLASTTSAYAVAIGTTAESNGVSIVAGTKITFAYAGTYNIQFSAQLASSDASIHDASIWLRKNGTDLSYTTGMVAVPNKHGTIDGKIIASWNYVLTLAAGDYLQLWWQAESTNVYLADIAAGTTPTTPITPSVIVTVQQVVKTQLASGAAQFVELTDVPSSYSGQAGKYVAVNGTETALEFVVGGGGGGGAPTNASYLTLSTNATLTNERVLTAGNGISITDLGPGSSLTIDSSTRSVIVTLDFGAGDYSTETVVTGQTWVSAGSSIIATIIDYSGNNSAEEAAAEGISVTIGNYVAGTGFTVYASSPFGSVGKYKVSCLGV